MQAVCSTSAASVKGLSLPRRTAGRPAACAVVCRAQAPKALAKKASAAAAAIPAWLAAHPALALVDDRLGGEGTGKMLGGEILPILGVLAAVWAIFYVGQKDLGGGSGEDSGMSL